MNQPIKYYTDLFCRFQLVNDAHSLLEARTGDRKTH